MSLAGAGLSRGYGRREEPRNKHVSNDQVAPPGANWPKHLQQMASPEAIRHGMNPSDGGPLLNPTHKGTTMNRINMTTIAAAITLAFSAGAMAEGLSKADYKAGKDKASA